MMVPSDFRVTLERQSCYGPCSVYTVAADASGNVAFTGRYYVDTLGEAQAQVGQEQLFALLDVFRAAEFGSLHECYLPREFEGSGLCELEAEDPCPEFFSDASTIITSIRANGIERRVVHYDGCVIPENRRLRGLENAVDRILDTCRWIGPEAYSCRGPSTD